MAEGMAGELERTTPVVVGVGQVLQRCDDPRDAAEPLEMMVTALARAGEDASAPKLLGQADRIYVLRGAWGYGDPGREIAGRLGVSGVETVGTPYGGNFSQACVLDAARAIRAGRVGVALVTGAENGRSAGQAQRQGITLRASEAPGSPDHMLADDKPLFHEAEIARGLNSASDIFALVESAIRFANGETLDSHARRIAALWARFSEVARDNPHAWIREPRRADEIREPSPDNPMISFPYTRLMNANARVDMGAGLVVCSLAAARSAGVPEDRMVYLHAAVEANDPDFFSTRDALHRSPALRMAGERVLELADRTIDRIEHVDLYSCFPSAVQVAATEYGLAQDRPLTVTGGLTFGGGPLNSYALHAIARMAEVVRADPGSRGLVSATGGWLAKHAACIYSTDPPEQGFRYDSPQEALDALPRREARVDHDGPVTIEASTVAHLKGRPRVGIATCLTDEGARTWATVDDPAAMEAMMREEHCGRRARIDGRGHLDLE